MEDYDCVVEHHAAMGEHCGHRAVGCYFAHVALCPLNLYQGLKQGFDACLRQFDPQFKSVCPTLEKPKGPLWHREL